MAGPPRTSLRDRLSPVLVPCLALGLAALGASAAPVIAPADAPPRPAHPSRIVALGLPADELTLALVDPARIVALDRFADDPGASNVVEAARAVEGRVAVQAESIAAAEPDLVLLPAWTGAELDASLHRFGIATLRVGTPRSTDDVRASIRAVAAALDAKPSGEALITDMDAALARTRARAAGLPRTSVLVDAGSGLTPAGDTLLAELVEIAGGELLLGARGERGLVPLSLERELSLDPDVLLVDAYRADARARGIGDATRGAYGLDARLASLRAVRTGRARPIAARLLLTTTHHVARTADALLEALHTPRPAS